MVVMVCGGVVMASTGEGGGGEVLVLFCVRERESEIDNRISFFFLFLPMFFVLSLWFFNDFELIEGGSGDDRIFWVVRIESGGVDLRLKIEDGVNS
jgi:hypothetical protein